MNINLKRFQPTFDKSVTWWIVGGSAGIVVILTLGGFLYRPLRYALFSLALVFAITGVIYLILSWYTHLKSELIRLNVQISEIDRQAKEAKRRLENVLQLSRKFLEANDEEEVIEDLLETVVYLTGSLGASIVPLDEQGQPLTLTRFGEFPKSASDAWLEYLATPEVRQTCGVCQHSGTQVQICPLIGESVWNVGGGNTPAGSIYCLPLRRGATEYGVLNLYFPPDRRMESDLQEFLRIVLAETALALEGLRLLKRERSTVHQLRATKQRTELSRLLSAFLENVHETFKSDLVVLSIEGRNQSSLEPIRMDIGQIQESDKSTIDHLLGSVLASGQSLLVGDVGKASGGRKSIRSMVAAPIGLDPSPASGVLLAGNYRPQSFSSRHLDLIRSFSDQINLVVWNAEMMAEVEFDTMIAERTRLAREIHDGLAQTLGFLKLQTAQMQNFFNTGNLARLEDSLSTSYKVLSEAYLDARQAIDDLRISPDEDGLVDWLVQTASEFESNTSIPVSLETDCELVVVQPEIQIQLIRMVQEALSNIRKHARASRAWIACHLENEGEELVIEVRDDGCGFSPEDVPGTSRYGLQGIRERSELIGATFEVISRPQEGAIVRIEYPLPIKEFRR